MLGDDRGRNIYGGYWPLSRAKAAGKAHRLWGTPAWSGNMWATSGLVPDIMQGGAVTVGGVQCDLDAALSTDYGQWPRPQASLYAHYTDGTTKLGDIAASREYANGLDWLEWQKHLRPVDAASLASSAVPPKGMPWWSERSLFVMSAGPGPRAPHRWYGEAPAGNDDLRSRPG